MSLKTRCPACDTVFKIVPDQLKVSKGWVRCGRCAEVFDAAAHAASSLSNDATATQWPQSSMPAVAIFTSPSTSLAATITPNKVAAKAVNITATTILASKNKIENEASSSSDLSFVRVAKNKAFWQGSAVTRLLCAASVGLAGLLFVQVVYSQRNHLVASNPKLKSGFDTVCQTVGCTIEPHKNIDAFKIDSSSFQKIAVLSEDSTRAEVFALKLSLKNNADMPLAMPAIELTLTDAADKPVVRRVLLAKDLGYNNATLAANGDWSGAASMVVSPNPAMTAVSGYRVLLFYP